MVIRRIFVGASIAIPILALTVLAILLLDAIARAGRPPFIDWFVYHDTVERGLVGSSLFDPRQLTGGYAMDDVIRTGSAYPPASVFVLLPFSWGVPGLLAWLVVNFGLLFTGLWAALRRDLGTRAVVPFAFSLLGLLLFLPFANAVITANVNIAIAGIYAWSWALGRSDARVGGLAAIGAVFKLFPSVLVLWPTGAARRRSIGLAIMTFLVLSILSLPIVGVHSWFELVSVLSNREPACGPSTLSIACALAPTTGMNAAQVIGLAVGAGLLLLALRVRTDRLAYVLFGAAMLAPVADLHPHYWLFAYVAGVVCAGGMLAAISRARISHPLAHMPFRATARLPQMRSPTSGRPLG